MTEQLAWSLAMARAQTLALASDIPAELACRQSQAGERHPCWLLGHLLLADSYLLTLLNVEKLPADFSDQLRKYGPGKAPMSAADQYDPAERLRDRLVQTGARRVDAVHGMSENDLARATPDPILAQMQPTIGQHLHALVFHEGYHAGQLSSWRRTHGFQAAKWGFAK